MTRVVVNLRRSLGTTPSGNYNNVDGAAAGEKVADLVDFDTGETTGISFHVDDSNASAGTNDFLTEDALGYAQAALEEFFLTTVASTVRFADLTAYEGYTYVLKLVGLFPQAADVDFTVGEETKTYVNENPIVTPADPVEFTGEIDSSGELAITWNRNGATGNGRFNIADLELTAPEEPEEPSDSSPHRGVRSLSLRLF